MRQTGPTYYDVLGIDQDATQNEIRHAYRLHARATHPDQNSAAGSSLFVLMQQAYEVLSNPGARAEYDAYLDGAVTEPEPAAASQAAARDEGAASVPRPAPVEFTPPAPPPASHAPQFGARGVTWRRLGCFGRIVVAVLALFLGSVPAGLVAAALNLGSNGSVPVLIASVVAVGWGLSRLYRRATSRPAFWCQHCGVRTDPRYRVCRACGRVKAAS